MTRRAITIALLLSGLLLNLVDSDWSLADEAQPALKTEAGDGKLRIETLVIGKWRGDRWPSGEPLKSRRLPKN